MIKKRIKKFLYRLTMSPKAYRYLKRSHKKMKQKNIDSAIDLLVEGTQKFPNNYRLRAELVDLAMKQKNWSLVIKQWENIFEMKAGKLKPQAFISYSRALQRENKIKTAENILRDGVEIHPNEEKLLMSLGNLFMSQKRWKESIWIWKSLLDAKDKKERLMAYENLAFVYIQMNDFEKAETIIKEGFKRFNHAKKLMTFFIDIAIYRMQWFEALRRIRKAIQHYQKKVPMNWLMKCSVIHQIVGNYSEAARIFEYVLQNYEDKIKQDKKGYRKYEIYNNGESKIEFYKKLQRTDKVVVTFDSINMVWKNPPFGFKLLKQQDVDIIAIRKKRPNTYHQDLSNQEFSEAIKDLVGMYQHKVAYGYSLGGYSSLYYGSLIDGCTILSLAPRCSIHPRYGKPEQIAKFEFKHSLELPSNSSVRPIIVYDSKQKMDNTYVKNEVLRAFPHAVIVDIPYGGHGIAPHLLRMGQLKEFVLTVVNENKIPKYDRKKKVNSNIYFRVLGQACLNRNKLNWAKDLAERSLELLATDKYGIKLKVNVLKRMGRYEEAIQFLHSSLKVAPELMEIRELLIDLYLEVEELIQAENALNQALEKFGEKSSFIARKKIIEEKKSKHLVFI